MKGYMNIVPLTQVVINKSPVEMKALLLQTAESAPTWDMFRKRAEDIAWIAFPDKSLNRVESSSKRNSLVAEIYGVNGTTSILITPRIASSFSVLSLYTELTSWRSLRMEVKKNKMCFGGYG
uniref:Uncharacterized protein n=1 Tax=Nosema pernyi TaxID=1112939 RepID=X5DYN4_9MICR|nr:hypothetical protein NP_05G12 [Nosema pernyi]